MGRIDADQFIGLLSGARKKKRAEPNGKRSRFPFTIKMTCHRCNICSRYAEASLILFQNRNVVSRSNTPFFTPSFLFLFFLILCKGRNKAKYLPLANKMTGNSIYFLCHPVIANRSVSAETQLK